MRPNLRTEQEIMKNWKGTKPVVSICCLAYNHEPYIEDALEGFLIQETNFPFEVLIHDDASTDHTADIIREYETAYPHIIKPIYQKENQYSKKVKISQTFQYPRAQGEYIAYCEGDDYWIHPNKLKEQTALLKKYPHIHICFHPAKKSENNKIIGIRNFYGYKQKYFSLRETILGDGDFMPTESILLRKKKLHEIESFMKLNNSGVGDIFIQILGANPNGALYIPQTYSTHRVNSINSWTRRIKENYPKRTQMYISVAQHIHKLIEILPQECKQEIQQLEAKKYFNAAISSILMHDFTKFKNLYSTAIKIAPNIQNRYFVIIKLMNKLPRLIYLLIKLYKLIKINPKGILK